MHYIGTIQLTVVGLRYYNASVSCTSLAFIRREYTNPHDVNAIAVFTASNEKCGHLSRENALWLSPLLDHEEIQCECCLLFSPNRKELYLEMHIYGLVTVLPILTQRIHQFSVVSLNHQLLPQVNHTLLPHYRQNIHRMITSCFSCCPHVYLDLYRSILRSTNKVFTTAVYNAMQKKLENHNKVGKSLDETNELHRDSAFRCPNWFQQGPLGPLYTRGQLQYQSFVYSDTTAAQSTQRYVNQFTSAFHKKPTSWINGGVFFYPFEEEQGGCGGNLEYPLTCFPSVKRLLSCERDAVSVESPNRCKMGDANSQAPHQLHSNCVCSNSVELSLVLIPNADMDALHLYLAFDGMSSIRVHVYKDHATLEAFLHRIQRKEAEGQAIATVLRCVVLASGSCLWNELASAKKSHSSVSLRIEHPLLDIPWEKCVYIDNFYPTSQGAIDSTIYRHFLQQVEARTMWIFASPCLAIRNIELYCRMLRLFPFSEPSIWSQVISRPIQQGNLTQSENFLHLLITIAMPYPVMDYSDTQSTKTNRLLQRQANDMHYNGYLTTSLKDDQEGRNGAEPTRNIKCSPCPSRSRELSRQVREVYTRCTNILQGIPVIQHLEDYKKTLYYLHLHFSRASMSSCIHCDQPLRSSFLVCNSRIIHPECYNVIGCAPNKKTVSTGHNEALCGHTNTNEVAKEQLQIARMAVATVAPFTQADAPVLEDFITSSKILGSIRKLRKTSRLLEQKAGINSTKPLEPQRWWYDFGDSGTGSFTDALLLQATQGIRLTDQDEGIGKVVEVEAFPVKASRSESTPFVSRMSSCSTAFPSTVLRVKTIEDRGRDGSDASQLSFSAILQEEHGGIVRRLCFDDADLECTPERVPTQVQDCNSTAVRESTARAMSGYSSGNLINNHLCSTESQGSSESLETTIHLKRQSSNQTNDQEEPEPYHSTSAHLVVITSLEPSLFDAREIFPHRDFDIIRIFADDNVSILAEKLQLYFASKKKSLLIISLVRYYAILPILVEKAATLTFSTHIMQNLPGLLRDIASAVSDVKNSISPMVNRLLSLL